MRAEGFHIPEQKQTCFTESISEMWSSLKHGQDPADWTFFGDPPRIASPTNQAEGNFFRFIEPTPFKKHLESTMGSYGAEVEYVDPYFSKESDVPKRATVFAGREFRYVRASSVVSKTDISQIPYSKYWASAESLPLSQNV